MKNLKFLIFLLTFYSLQSGAQNLRVKIFSESQFNSLSTEAIHGNYQIHSPSGYIAEYNEGQSLHLQLNTSKKLHLTKNGEFLGLFDTLFILQSNHQDYLKIKPEGKITIKPRQYEGDFEVTANQRGIQLLNLVFTESYLEGVLRSEAGTRCAKEYYKVQAIISRTFAKNNVDKHEKDGFFLCDAVHCQAYYGRYNGESKAINEGVKDTYGLVLVDSAGKSFPTFFSANCGGQSAETDQIWNVSLPNYVSRPDTFCIHTRQANWEQYIAKKEFLEYLSKNFFFDLNDEFLVYKALNFEQKQRKTFFIDPSLGIPLRDIRAAFNLRSTFFSCEPVGEKILLKGKGFGHGIGLCQEGAMEMVGQGKTYNEILKFYFKGSKLSTSAFPINHW